MAKKPISPEELQEIEERRRVEQREERQKRVRERAKSGCVNEPKEAVCGRGAISLAGSAGVDSVLFPCWACWRLSAQPFRGCYSFRPRRLKLVIPVITRWAR